jgi:hypothetical protein
LRYPKSFILCYSDFRNNHIRTCFSGNRRSRSNDRMDEKLSLCVLVYCKLGKTSPFCFEPMGQANLNLNYFHLRFLIKVYVFIKWRVVWISISCILFHHFLRPGSSKVQCKYYKTLIKKLVFPMSTIKFSIYKKINL